MSMTCDYLLDLMEEYLEEEDDIAAVFNRVVDEEGVFQSKEETMEENNWTEQDYINHIKYYGQELENHVD